MLVEGSLVKTASMVANNCTIPQDMAGAVTASIIAWATFTNVSGDHNGTLPALVTSQVEIFVSDTQNYSTTSTSSSHAPTSSAHH
jgi:hypothetical protein